MQYNCKNSFILIKLIFDWNHSFLLFSSAWMNIKFLRFQQVLGNCYSRLAQIPFIQSATSVRVCRRKKMQITKVLLDFTIGQKFQNVENEEKMKWHFWEVFYTFTTYICSLVWEFNKSLAIYYRIFCCSAIWKQQLLKVQNLTKT